LGAWLPKRFTTMSPRLVWMVAFAVAMAVMGIFFHGGPIHTGPVR
jgi:hypothetical protein